MLENNSKEQKVLQCYFCGNETLMNLVANHKEDYADEQELVDGYNWAKLFICPVCKKVTYLEERYFSEDFCINEKGHMVPSITNEILYPINTFDGGKLPAHVQKSYEAALKIRKIDSSMCLIALRKTLEIICNEKGAKGKNLWEKLRYLSDEHILPPALKDASIITKDYGNIGAHDHTIYISDYEVNTLVEFVKYILDYLYVIPAKLERMQDQLTQNKSKEEVTND